MGLAELREGILRLTAAGRKRMFGDHMLRSILWRRLR
jgi:hypothetical protein